MEINPGESVFAHPLHHMREVIFGIRVPTIRINRHKANAAVQKFVGNPAGVFIGSRDVRTMIAGKENHQDGIAREIREGVSVPISRRQSKPRREIANLQGEAHGYWCTGERTCANGPLKWISPRVRAIMAEMDTPKITAYLKT